MRCKNCGWENPINNAKCEKCNTPLTDCSTGKPNDSSCEKHESKKTSNGCSECGYPVREAEKSCPRCGHLLGVAKQAAPEVSIAKQATPEDEKPTPDVYEPVEKTCALCKEPVPENARFCQNCGASFLAKENQVQDDTMNPWVQAEQIQSPKCSLSFISGNDEPANDVPLRFSGNVIHLHRGNTEPDNQTITSKTQAELSFENDKWYIQDKSALKTTYIYAGEKKELVSGDIIVLGNRVFKFNCDSANQPE